MVSVKKKVKPILARGYCIQQKKIDQSQELLSNREALNNSKMQWRH